MKPRQRVPGPLGAVALEKIWVDLIVLECGRQCEVRGMTARAGSCVCVSVSVQRHHTKRLTSRSSIRNPPKGQDY